MTSHHQSEEEAGAAAAAAIQRRLPDISFFGKKKRSTRENKQATDERANDGDMKGADRRLQIITPARAKDQRLKEKKRLKGNWRGNARPQEMTGDAMPICTVKVRRCTPHAS